MNGMFEQAARVGLRFESVKGSLTVEDLWNLPLLSRNGIDLDNIAKALALKLKDSDLGSFVKRDKKKDDILQLKFDIVKHIIDVRLDENVKATEKMEASDKKKRILAIIAEKEDENLMGKSLDELKDLANSL